MIKTLLKSILPKRLVEHIKSYRKERRFQKRFAYNRGKAFFKTVATEGVTFEISLNPYLNSGVDDVIAELGVWEPAIGAQIKKHLHKGGVFIDIGANIGYHSLLAAKVLEGKGQVYSFEPQESIYLQFKDSIARNGLTNITVYNTALSDHNGDETLYVREENSGGSTLLSIPETEGFHIQSKLKVALVTLDSFIEKFKQVDLIKIDVEGYEYEVFKGGRKLLEQFHPTIIMEFSPVFYMQDYESKAEELLHFLESCGYTFFDMSGEKLDIYGWLRSGDNKHSQLDIICEHHKA